MRGRRGGRVDARPGRWLITKIFDLCERSCSGACVMSAYYISRTTINHRSVSDRLKFLVPPRYRIRHCFEGTFGLKRARQRFSG